MELLSDFYESETLLNKIEDETIDIETEEEDFEEIEEDGSKRRLYIDKVDKSVADLLRMIHEGELNLQPEYQRKFVWSEKVMSQFIESLLLSIPIPTIFLAENEDETFEVIDGQQRLSTIVSFAKDLEKEVKGVDQSVIQAKPLILKGLSTLKDLNGKSYVDFDSRLKRKFRNVSLPIVIIQKDSSEDIKYDIFSRINQGSVKLNSQELLNVMYRGEFISELNKISNNDLIDDLFENRPVLKKRSGYNEILLRAFVMSDFIDQKWKIRQVQTTNSHLEKEYRKYSGRLNMAIVEFLKEFRNDIHKSQQLTDFVFDSVEKVRFVFGKDAFKRKSSNSRATSINKTIAELQLVVLGRFTKESVEKNAEAIRKSFENFVEKNETIFTRATNNTSNVEKRYSWGREVQDLGVKICN